MTVKHAMLGWIDTSSKQPEVKPRARFSRRLDSSPDQPTSRSDISKQADSLWDDVSKKHFEVTKVEILETVGKWVQEVKSAPVPAPPAGPKKKTNKKPAFSGTGFAGKALGGDSVSTPTKPANMDGTLKAQLQGALSELQNASGRLGWVGGPPAPSFDGDEDEDLA